MESSPYANEGTKNKKWKVAKLLPQTSHQFSETEEQAVFLAVLSPPTFGFLLLLHFSCIFFVINLKSIVCRVW